MDKFDLITFDCYGTLIDWETGIAKVIETLARELKVEMPVKKLVARYVKIEFGLEQAGYRPYREILAMGLRLLFEERGIQLSQRQSLALTSSLPHWKPFPETRRVLKALHKAGYRLGVLSNADDSLLHKSLKRIGVPIDIAVTSQQVRSYKPRAKHWERALAVSKTKRSRVLHVAASQLHDIIPAKSLGFHCAWINRSRDRHAVGVRPYLSFETLAPLQRALTLGASRSRRN